MVGNKNIMLYLRRINQTLTYSKFYNKLVQLSISILYTDVS
jgi:hypothetical protein